MQSSCRFFARACAAFFFTSAFSFAAHAALKVVPGYRVRTVFDSGAAGTAGGLTLDQDGSAMYCGVRTNIFRWALPFSDGFASYGAIAPNSSVSAVAAINGDVFAAGAASFSPPFPYNFGRLRDGVYTNLFEMDGLFDASADLEGRIYVVANPGGAGTQILAYDPVSNSVSSFVTNGGYSGGIVVRDGDGIYYADQNNGAIVKYADTNTIIIGPIYPMPPLEWNSSFDPNPQVVVSNAWGAYLSFDPKDRLLAAVDFNNSLNAYDPLTGRLLQTVATDDAGGYGIQQVSQNWYTREIVVLFTDWSVGSSKIYALRPFWTEKDTDGNHIANLLLFNPKTAAWKIIAPESSGTNTATFGCRNGQPVIGDFDGDGLGDLAVRNPLTGQWSIRYSSPVYSTSATPVPVIKLPAGPNNIPASADYDGDGKTDPAVYNRKTGVLTIWSVMQPLSKPAKVVPVVPPAVVPGGIPVPGDYNGNGRDEFCVYVPGTGSWIEPSGDALVLLAKWGWSGATPVPADYDGDGKTDIAVFDNTTAVWHIIRSSDGKPVSIQFGFPGCIPVPADYDGDQKADIAVFDPAGGMFWTFRSTGGLWQAKIGASGFQVVTP